VRKKSLLSVAACAAALAGLSAGPAFAGEVNGPPGTPGVPNSGSGKATGAPAHANSICSFSGLHDMVPDEGPIDFIVQSPGQNVRTAETPPGIPCLACRGGSNPQNPPSP
jgi:hypothetical protein